MPSLPALFSDLALILISAGVTTVLFRWLKQPLVLGYMIVGVLIGPNVTQIPVITDTQSVETWSEIGMVFLLFALGLEFKLKRLKKKAGSVGLSAITEVLLMGFVGFFLGRLIGWSKMDSVFLASMLCMSSTTIIVKAFEDLKLKKESFTEHVIGVLVVEDLVAILLMLGLSTLAVSTALVGKELVSSVMKLVFFILAWYVIGVFLIPTILKWCRAIMTEETLTVFAVGLCFSMVWLSNKAGFSSALGAFIMGMVLSETLEAEIIQRLITPIKNLFGALFFVSVGMMVNPAMLVEYWWQILVITLVTLVFKPLCSFIGSFLSENNLRNAVRSSVCSAQIGEFSFVIASVGLGFGLIDQFLYPIIVSVSVITTFFTPYLIKMGDPLYERLNRKMPGRWRAFFESKEKTIKDKNGKKMTSRSFVMTQLKRMVLYSSVIISICVISFSVFTPLLNSIRKPFVPVLCLLATSILISLICWALAFRRDFDLSTLRLSAGSRRYKPMVGFLFALRFLVAWFLVSYLVRHFLDQAFWMSTGVQVNDILAAVIISLAYLVLLKVLTPVMKWYEHIEKVFLDNMNKRNSLQSFVVPEILQENFSLEKMTLNPKSLFAGQSIRHNDFMRQYNVSVVGVDRAEEVLDLPRRDFVLYPMDEVTFLGTEEQLAKLRPLVEVEDEVLVKERPASDMDIHRMVVGEKSSYAGVTLHDSDLLNRFNTLVIAVERDDDFILNPASSIRFQVGDTVWFVATDAKTQELITSSTQSLNL